MADLYELRPQRREIKESRVGQVRLKPHHKRLFVGYLALVLLPLVVATGYFAFWASDRFTSQIGMTVYSDAADQQFEVIQSLSSLSGGTRTDAAIVRDFLESREFSDRLSGAMDLTTVLSPSGFDPLFWMQPKTSEQIHRRWLWLSKVSLDSRTGILSIQVSGFSPEHAQSISEVLVSESQSMLARLSENIRRESTLLAGSELERAQQQLKQARTNLVKFRASERIVDPIADLEGQLGLMASLQGQLAEARIALNLLRVGSSESDPRLEVAQNRVSVIAKLIEDERQKFGSSTDSFADRATAYEALIVDLEHAQESYLKALAVLDAAKLQAQKQSKYLAVHVSPTFAEEPEYPKRLQSVFVLFIALHLFWVILVLGLYGARDRA